LGDCNAEMRRRDLEAPGDQVSAEIAQVQEQIRENSQDPEVLKAIADFRRRLRSPDAQLLRLMRLNHERLRC
jgi:hypothetical protein